MQKWEYKTILRRRSWAKDTSTKNAKWAEAGDWVNYTDGRQENDLEKLLPRLGDEGWELVSITPRSDYLGGNREGNSLSNYAIDYAGFTSSELWVFKRPKP